MWDLYSLWLTVGWANWCNIRHHMNSSHWHSRRWSVVRRLENSQGKQPGRDRRSELQWRVIVSRPQTYNPVHTWWCRWEAVWIRQLAAVRWTRLNAKVSYWLLHVSALKHSPPTTRSAPEHCANTHTHTPIGTSWLDFNEVEKGKIERTKHYAWGEFVVFPWQWRSSDFTFLVSSSRSRQRWRMKWRRRVRRRRGYKGQKLVNKMESVR